MCVYPPMPLPTAVYNIQYTVPEVFLSPEVSVKKKVCRQLYTQYTILPLLRVGVVQIYRLREK